MKGQTATTRCVEGCDTELREPSVGYGTGRTFQQRQAWRMRENRHARAGPSTFPLPSATKVLICSPVTSRGAEGPSKPGSEGTHVGDPPGGSGTALWELG